MTAQDVEPPGWLERALAPRALLAGVLAGFVACCLAGHRASERDPLPRSVERFHYFLSPETLYYPTPGQVRAFARRRLDPDRIAVVVAGTSIFQGSGQPLERVWTRRLRALLGDDFRVVNLAMRGGRTVEVGTQTAEMLLGEFPRLIVVTDACMGQLHAEPDGLHFRRFYWDARAQGLLWDEPERDRRLAELCAAAAANEQDHRAAAWPTFSLAELRELQRAALLEHPLRFRELWNAVAARWVSTVWLPPIFQPFYCARHREQSGTEFMLPAAQRPPEFEARLHSSAAETVRNNLAFVATVRGPEDLAQRCEQFAEDARAAFPQRLRGRSVVVQMRLSDAYLEALRPEERAACDRLFTVKGQCLQQLGFTVIDVGRDFAAADFADPMHLAPSGGEKLAAAVATAVRALARRRGYLSGDGP